MLTPPIPVALPLLMAALMAALNRRVTQGLASFLAIATAAAVACVCVSMMVSTRLDPAVYWFGGWAVRQGAPVGIAFVVDEMGAALALLASLLVTFALIFSSRYFDTVGTIFQCLMLVFLAGMCGFCLTGDIFNLFVFFELMSAAAYALCGYKSEEPGPLQGTLNFAVTNTVGAFLVLTGIALLYGRTGALNLAQIGRSLGRADGLAIAAFSFVTAGFAVKAAIVPMHFWLADAHAVAPTPVCILFSGVMVELGLYAIVRVYWTVFSGPLGPHESSLRAIMAAAGALTALVGGIMCFAQRHIKRLLAFSTVSHMGLMLTGAGLLTAGSLAGTAVYVFAHGLIKASLFVCAGILLHRTGSVDEFDLRGRGRQTPGTGAVFAAGALGLAGLPGFGTFLADGLVAGDAARLGYGWVPWVGSACSMLTAGAVFRVAGRVFGGWGREVVEGQGSKIPEEPETHGGGKATPAVMYVPATLLLAAAVLMSFAPGLPESAHRAAAYFVDRPAYAARVLDGFTPPPHEVRQHVTRAADVARALVSVAGALLLAAAALSGRRVLPRFSVAALRRLHSGVVCDYVLWVMAGFVVFGVLSAVFLT